MFLPDFLGKVRWPTDSLPSDTPCYLRRRTGDNDGLTPRGQASTARGGD